MTAAIAQTTTAPSPIAGEPQVLSFPPVHPDQPLDDWLWSPEELEEQMGQGLDPLLPPAPAQIDSLELAERHLAAVARFAREQAAFEAHAKQPHDRIDFWLNARVAGLERKATWHRASLNAFLINSGKKTLKLINGTLKLIAGRERVEVADPEHFVAIADEQFVRTKVIKEPDKRAILTHIHSTGEIPDGAELVRGDDSFKVVLPEEE
jgi:hypothetical protein